MTVPHEHSAFEEVGFRAWYVWETFSQRTGRWQAEPRLLSLNGGLVWPPGRWAVAAEGTPGIHAGRHGAHLQDLGYGDWDDVVVGRVGLAGDVTMGSLGFQATKARPVRLWVPYTRWQLVDALADVYQVPVELGDVKKGAQLCATSDA